MKLAVRSTFTFGALVVASVLSTSARASIVETYEAAGVMNTTTSFNGSSGVETFTGRSSGGFTTNFGGSSYIGTYNSGTQIKPADLYGGAGGNGNYAVTFTGSNYTLSLNQSATYFGYWLSAADAGNMVAFYKGANLVGSLNQAALLSAIGGNAAYYGNPNPQFKGQNGAEPYVFVNFYDTDAAGFDRVVFSEMGAGTAGYETDNHTVGNFANITGTTVPEPSSSALVVVALAGVGFTASRRNKPGRG